MVDFSVPDIQNEVNVLPPKRASEEAFYAATTKGGPDIINNYNTSVAELQQTGQSEFVNIEKEKWEREQEQINKETISGILGDPTVSKSIKRAVAQGYAITGVLPSTLKDKYVQKTASLPNHNTIDDRESQDTIVSILNERVAQNNKEVESKSILAGTYELSKIFADLTVSPISKFESSGKIGGAITSIGSSILASIPAGFAGLYKAIVDNDSASGAELIGKIQHYATYEPTDKATQYTKEAILKAAEVVGIPAKTIGNFINTYSNVAAQQYAETVYPEQVAKDIAFGREVSTTEPSAGLATAAEIVLDPVNWIPFARGAKSKIEFPHTIDPNSPLEITNIANPKAAEQAALGALAEPTGKLASALGTDKSRIVHDWVLPKVLPEDLAKTHPDLSAKLIADMNAADDAIRASYIQSRYDANILNVTAREAEVDQIMQITRESNSPYYIQSKSLINETDELFEGNAVYGRNSNSGYTRQKDAQEAYKNLKESIDQLPEELRGSLSIVKFNKQYYINHQWKKEYKELDLLTFGKDAIQTSVLGMDVSWLARSAVGRWIFPTGRFPKWMENSSLRSVEHAGKIKEDLTKTIRENIASSQHKRELAYLIEDVEAKGIDYYSPEQISSMFPKLSKKQSEDLFVTHTWWNRQQQYNHNFLNREVRNKLTQRGMQGLYAKDGTYIGHATDKVSPTELDLIKEVWDFDKKAPVSFSKEMLDTAGTKLVRLNDPIRGTGTEHNFALLGTNAHLNILPQEVVQRIPGYSGRKVAESWYISVTPKKLTVDGVTKTDSKGLASYTQVKAAAKTKHEAMKLQEQLQENYPDHIVSAIPERQDNFGRVMTDYGIHQENLKHSMKRGERLPSLNGPARLEDRMVTLINTTAAQAKMAGNRTWEEGFQRTFTKSYNQFLEKGEFPQFSNQITTRGRRLNDEEAIEYKNAHALFKQYERIKNSETPGDFYYTTGLHAIADVLEKWKLPGYEYLGGKHENPLMWIKKAATVAYIHLNVPRQWVIQTSQQLEMYAINPANAAKNFSNMLAIRAYIGLDATMMKDVRGPLQDAFKKQAELAGNKDFLDDIEAIKKSGMLQSVDMNSIVHGVFRDTARQLNENIPTKIAQDLSTMAKAPIRAARTVGFDAAELTNRVGNWLQVKDLWKLKNPGKNWKTREAQEEIAAEALKLSGAMNRAGQLPYQEGMLSIPLQFVAISQKMLLNIIQDNTTILNGTQRAKLAVARAALFGTKYGIPGGVIAHNFIDKTDDEEVKKNAEIVKEGLIDRATNGLIASLVEPEENTQLAVAKMMSPYNEGFLPYFEFLNETYKLFDNKPAGPKYPGIGVMGSFYEAMQDMHGWFITNEVNETNYKQAFMEAAEVASGFNNYTQGLVMLGMRDKITKMGNKYGMEFTANEAYAKMFFGIASKKEEDLWKLVELEKDTKAQKKEMANVLHRQIENQIRKRGLTGDESEYATRLRMVNNFVNILDPKYFSEADKLDVINQISQIDKKNYQTIKESILVDNWKYHQEKRTKNRQQADDILNRSTDPQIKKYVEALRKGNP